MKKMLLIALLLLGIGASAQETRWVPASGQGVYLFADCPDANKKLNLDSAIDVLKPMEQVAVLDSTEYFYQVMANDGTKGYAMKCFLVDEKPTRVYQRMPVKRLTYTSYGINGNFEVYEQGNTTYIYQDGKLVDVSTVH